MYEHEQVDENEVKDLEFHSLGSYGGFLDQIIELDQIRIFFHSL